MTIGDSFHCQADHLASLSRGWAMGGDSSHRPISPRQVSFPLRPLVRVISAKPPILFTRFVGFYRWFSRSGANCSYGRSVTRPIFGHIGSPISPYSLDDCLRSAFRPEGIAPLLPRRSSAPTRRPRCMLPYLPSYREGHCLLSSPAQDTHYH